MKTITAILILLLGHAMGSSQDNQEKPELPKIQFEDATYVLGNIGGNQVEYFNEYFPEGVKPAEAQQFLALRYYPKKSDPVEFVQGFSKSLESQTPKVTVERVTSADPNIEGMSFIMTGPDGALEYNLFLFMKPGNSPGLFARHFVKKGSGDMAEFQAATKKESLNWVKELVNGKFPALIPPKGAGKQAGGLPDPATLPPLFFKEETPNDVKIGNASIKGLSVGSKITVDEAFTTEWENSPPAVPFAVIVPKNDLIFSVAGGKKSGAKELLRVTLANEEKDKVVEVLRFSSLTLPLNESKEDRLKLCAHLLKSSALPMVFNGKKDPKLFEAYATKIGGADAVVFNGQNIDPEQNELYFVKVVGIVHPDKPGGVLAFLSASAERSSIKKPEDLQSEGVGMKVLHSLKFVD